MHPRLLNGVVALAAAAAAANAGAGPADPPPSPIRFRDVAAEAGVDFRFDDGSRGRHDLPEIMGGGVALIDVDGDGRLDLYLTNGGPIGDQPGRPDPPCRLFRNLGAGRFADITDRAGAPGPSYAMGVAVGDVDGDGRDDLLVTGWRDQRLYLNRGDGRFRDITAEAGLALAAWGTSAALADLDGDGDLDLYVATYVDYDPAVAPFCAAPDGRRDYCGPEDFTAQADHLYRNDGRGHFTDVSRASGVDLPGGRGLGVVVADLVGDGRPDLLVANDGTPCWLFENRGDLHFVEVGLAAGVALDGRGNPLAGMGVAAGDIDGDGRLDLAVSNFFGRGTVGFRNLGAGHFADASGPLGLGPTRPVLGFGVALADFDGDGRLDLIQANGHVLDRARLGTPLAQRPTVLAGLGGRLVDATRGVGPWFDRPVVGRGLAVGDLDDDGRPDVVVACLGGTPAAILRNESGGDTPRRWLTLELRGHRLPAAPGAVVRAEVGGRSLFRAQVGGGGYLAADARRVHLGLGRHDRAERVEVTWPSGRVEVWRDLPAGHARLVEGTAPR